MMIQEIRGLVIEGRSRQIQETVQKAVDEGLGVKEIINDGLIAAMYSVGEKFKVNEVYVPEVLMSARTMLKGMEVLRPLFAQAGIKEKAVFLIGTVKGDLHDIGTNIVSMMMEGAGYKVVNIGVDKTAEEFVQAVKQHSPKVVGLAALLTSTLPEMKETIKSLSPYRDKIKIVVGGAPVTQKFADEIGADAYAPDAGTAVTIADAFIAG
ncbi:MAG: corrinoid protein [Negativicutes bacterium]|nr:corrinoid protein [Negativicutes bacterium]